MRQLNFYSLHLLCTNSNSNAVSFKNCKTRNSENTRMYDTCTKGFWWSILKHPVMIVFSRAMSPMRPCPFQPSPRSIGHHATCRTSWPHLEGLTRPLPLLSSWYCKPTSNDRCTRAASPLCLTLINNICHWFKSAVAWRRFIYCKNYLPRQPIILRWVCW